ncbi:TPA: hypothetical protein ACRZ6V_005533 [Vibrio harveyi]|uniref:hypothetical protein n=1 Tax=Vibrio harveyi TaxID=669 RepID=UPI0030F66B9A
MNKIIVLGLCGALAACGGDDSTDNNVSVLPDESSIYDGVYTADNGDSFFYSKKEETSFVFSPPVRDDLGTPAGSNRLISFKPVEVGKNLLKAESLAKVDTGTTSLLYLNSDIDIELFENEINIVSMAGIDPDFGTEKVFYQNKRFEKLLNNQFIDIPNGVYKDFYNTDVTISDQTTLKTIYDSERDLLCDVTMRLVKSKYYYQAHQATIECDDTSHSINGDYVGVVYAANEQAIVALTKSDLSQTFRTSFALN